MHLSHFRLLILCFSFIVLGYTQAAFADSTDDIVNALVTKGVLTEEEGSLILKNRSSEKKVAETKKASAVNTQYKENFIFETGDGKSSLAINGRLHFDGRYYDYNKSNNTAGAASASGANTFDIRRARLGAKVKFDDYYSGEIVLNGTGSAPILDIGYLNIAWWEPVQFRVGLFKMPFSLEQLTGANYIDFIERSFVDYYAAGKELGAMVHGEPRKGVTYGLAFSSGSNVAETDIRVDNKDIVGRVTANFAEIFDKKDMLLHAGLAYSTGDIPKSAGLGGNRYSEARGPNFLTAPVIGTTDNSDKAIDRSRLGLEAIIAYKDFKFQSQWLTTNYDFSTPTASYDLDVKTWYVEALWTISGKAHADRYKNGITTGLKPKVDFNPATFSGGAWEIGARYSRFNATDFNNAGLVNAATDASITTKGSGFAAASAWTVGVQFVPNPHVRLMLDYVDTHFEKPIAGISGIVVNGKSENSEQALLMRTQLNF